MSLSEFGFFSCFITKNENEEGKRTTIENKIIGTLMRTKASHNNEGGVNAGYSVIDSPLIVPADVFSNSNQQVAGTVQF